MSKKQPPAFVLERFPWPSIDRIDTVEIGLINETYRVETKNGTYALQCMHPTFGGEVNDDIAVLTNRLAEQGVLTTRIVQTRTGQNWVGYEGKAWRALTWLPGESVHRSESLERFRSAGRLVARFHNALHGFNHTFAFVREGVHDTARHLGLLRDAMNEASHARSAVLKPLAEEILAYPRRDLEMLPKRIIHGDLKLSNLLFEGDEAVTLVDLDTLQVSNVAMELGDAFRSWCNPTGEDSRGPIFRRDIRDAAMEGYESEVGDWLTNEERVGIDQGTEFIAAELAARFCLDAYRESYFRWDAARYETASHHHEARARAQLQLAALAAPL